MLAVEHTNSCLDDLVRDNRSLQISKKQLTPIQRVYTFTGLWIPSNIIGILPWGQSIKESLADLLTKNTCYKTSILT